MNRTLSIAFVHPDLGIGGAERLVVDAAVGLKERGHNVVLFYCHFPDKLLARRDSILASIYRRPVDWVEEVTTGVADSLAVNSGFTESIFRKHFPSLRERKLEIIYPGILLNAYDQELDTTDPAVQTLESSKRLIVSLNRFERKKDIGLAIRAFAKLRETLPKEAFEELRLVVAGGYDTRVSENVQYHLELAKVASSLGLSHFTLFPNPYSQRTFLLRRAVCLLYTPHGEHFGIVPVEAMYSRLPVVASDSGGPRESIVNGVTGYLCGDGEDEWGARVADLVNMGEKSRATMGQAARDRVVKTFSAAAMADKLDAVVRDMVGTVQPTKVWWPVVAVTSTLILLITTSLGFGHALVWSLI
ncbi:Alpha-1,3-mannosyltransferase-like protein [Gonapodya sp. JEL0774]|nr:Alpha-1,3-mannosyltransferase-like protein [Gonapodya sp. JEL0774]